MCRLIMLLLFGGALLAAAPAAGGRHEMGNSDPQASGASSSNTREQSVKVTITTGGGLYGPAQSRFRVGERVPVSITMENTSAAATEVCVSGTLYQDTPTLAKDGRPLPYAKGQQQELEMAEKNEVCKKLNLPERIALKPGERKAVAGFVLAEGATTLGDQFWYEPLQPGKYELSIKRRTDCCAGPSIVSNKITFEVVR